MKQPSEPEKKMNTTRYTVAAARINASGEFKYTEIETVDADEMIVDLTGSGYTAWLVGAHTVSVAPVARDEKAEKLAKAKAERDAAASGYLVAASDYSAGMIARSTFTKAFNRHERAEKAYQAAL